MRTMLLPICIALLTDQFAESQNALNQINADFPRDPYIPANRRWWTRMFDAGVNFIRIGQYENSSDYTSWDWV